MSPDNLLFQLKIKYWKMNRWLTPCFQACDIKWTTIGNPIHTHTTSFLLKRTPIILKITVCNLESKTTALIIFAAFHLTSNGRVSVLSSPQRRVRAASLYLEQENNRLHVTYIHTMSHAIIFPTIVQHFIILLHF